jgi:hypothetical protein
MNTYRVYVLDTTDATAPLVHVAFIAADKYGPAWQGARAALNGTKGAPSLFSDVERSTRFTSHGDAFTVAKIDDIRPRNVKIDKAALAALLTGEGDAATKIAAMAAALGVKA